VQREAHHLPGLGVAVCHCGVHGFLRLAGFGTAAHQVGGNMNDYDHRIMWSNEGRNAPVCDVDSVIGCTVIAVLFLVVLVTAPDWWPVLVVVMR
jgi:hypothetical protein